ncbi:protein cornichon homolog 4-like [Apium graveolens]|uniref:protein cornichon homolog 4-like n=1 Tax=Apium graveolens TaxID=4045 RepID=UPI003D7B1261
MADLLSWLLSFFILVTTLGIVLYQLMCLADLELDFINPYDLATKINQVIMLEFLSHGSLCVLHLLSGHWLMFLLCLPYVYYNATLYTERQHLVDVTEIFNQLKWQKMQRICKLAYLACLVILSIFWMIWSILDEEEM